MKVLMVGRKPSIALEELRRYWGHVEVRTGFFFPRGNRYDLVVAQEPTLKIGVPALLQAKLSKSKFICEVHGNYLRTGFLPIKDLLAAKFVLRSSDYVRAVSAQIAESLKSWNIRNVIIVPSIYVDLLVFRNLIPQSRRGSVVLTVSRLVPEKAVDLLIEAVPHILKEVPHVNVRIVGEGPDRKRLESLVRDKRVEDVVRFYGWVSREELVKHYNEAAVFVCTSLHEGGPRTVFEAVACGTPFVSTAVGLVPEVFKHGVEGFILRERNVAELSDYVVKLLKDPVLREEMGSRGIETVRNRFEWSSAVRRYALTYLELVEKRV